jgi:beta-glucosidase-like glycosyl hydrolase
MDDRTMHELYLWPFADAVKAGAASFMCAYQRLNGSYACENSKAQNGILKTELGFRKSLSASHQANNVMYLTSLSRGLHYV